jgi:glycosyltransferase involved in cell wall biosynthesis
MKIYLNEANESWVVDRFRKEWIENNLDSMTENIEEADIVWIIAPWTWEKINKKHLKNKKVVCTIHHIDFEKFNNKEKKNFYKRDKYVDIYHAISTKTEEQVRSLTDKDIETIPFWINQNIFYEIKNKNILRSKFNLNAESFIVGSFQRDTEGKDLVSPKLSKGPDRFIEILIELSKKNKNIEVLLTGKRRDYLIKNLKKNKIPYIYHEMTTFEKLNELYNCIDLYIVASRVEGGPQAILECAITKTPIISTDVGIASKILHESSIFTMENFSTAKPSESYAYKNSIKYKIPEWFGNFDNLFKSMI